MNFNQITSIASMIVGIVLSVVVSLHYFLVGGIQYIITNSTIIGNKIIVSDVTILLGVIRMSFAGLAFALIFNFFFALSAHYYANYKKETE